MRFGDGSEQAIDDNEIILEVLTGNRNAYADIVRKYEQRIRGYCRTALFDQTLAEDAAQEIFIKVYQALGKFKGASSFSTWLYRIAVNHCTDLIRRKMRQRTESWEALVESKGDKIEALFVAPPTVQNFMEQSELITELLSHLPEKSRTLLILREMHGLSYQELARALECSLDAVKARLKRARQELEIKLRHLSKESVV